MIDDCNVLDQDYCLLLAYELLYLWNALGACLKHSHAAIQIGKYLHTTKLFFPHLSNKALGASPFYWKKKHPKQNNHLYPNDLVV